MSVPGKVAAAKEQQPSNHRRALRTATIISTFGGLLFGYEEALGYPALRRAGMVGVRVAASR